MICLGVLHSSESFHLSSITKSSHWNDGTIRSVHLYLLRKFHLSIMYYYSYNIYRGDTHYTDCFLSMCQIHSFFIYQSLGNVFLLPFFLVLHLFSTLKVDSSLIFSAFLSRKVCIWRCNWKNGWCWTKSREKWRKIIGLLTFVNKRAFSMISSSFWMVECDPFLCIITPQALESSKRSQDHRGNSTHTHKHQPQPSPASAMMY